MSNVVETWVSPSQLARLVQASVEEWQWMAQCVVPRVDGESVLSRKS
jgi:hypothetical protein